MMEWLNSVLNWLGDFFSKLGTTIFDWMKTQGPRILGSIIILVVGWWLSAVIAKGVKKALSKSKVDAGVSSFIYSMIKTVLLVIVVISAIAQLGINITSVIAALGAAGITAGLALKDTLSNFASGVFILFNKPFVAGDYIEVDGSAGTVGKIELMFTTLKTPDNKHLVYPNSKLTEGKVINHTSEKMRRLDLQFPAPYDVDSETVKAVILDVYSRSQYILNDEDKRVVVGISEFADSAVIYEVRAWILAADYSGARFDLNEKVKAAFDRHGISIPFSQVDVTIKNN